MTLPNMLTAARRFVSDDKGVTAVEYGVLGALIIVVCITAVTLVGANLSTTLGTIATSL